MKARFDLNAIRNFAAVAAAGSMSSASTKLQIPTSTISRSIARLEKQLGIQLLRRGQHGIVLTDAGSEYLPSCLEALDELERGERALREGEAGRKETVRVACPITMARELLSPLMPEFSARFPELTVDIATYAPGPNEPSGTQVDILFHLWPLKKQDRPPRRFPSTRRGIYASVKCIENLGQPQSPEDLARYPTLGSHAVPAFERWLLKNASDEVALDLNFRFGACDPEMLRKMVVDGLGISTLPVWLALRPGTREHLVRVLPDWEPSPVPLYATCSRAEGQPDKVSSLLQFLNDRVGTSLDPRALGENTDHCFIREGATALRHVQPVRSYGELATNAPH